MYYLSNLFSIIEVEVSLPLSASPPYYTNSTARYPNSTLPISFQTKLANITNPSSISAIYTPTLGIRLYYLDSSLGFWDPPIKTYKPAAVKELSWTHDSGWTNLDNPHVLNATAHDSGAALAAAVVEPDFDHVQQEIHVLYSNTDLNVEMVSWTNGSWGSGTSPLPFFFPSSSSHPQITF